MISVQSVVFALIIKTDNVETDVITTGLLDSAGSDWDPVVGYCKQGKEELGSMQDKPKGIHILMDVFVNRHTCYCADLYSCIGKHYWKGTKILNPIELT